jgi:hypothetical protein
MVSAGAVNKWALGMPVGLVQSFPGHETVRAHRKNLENYYTLVLNQPLRESIILQGDQSSIRSILASTETDRHAGAALYVDWMQ